MKRICLLLLFLATLWNSAFGQNTLVQWNFNSPIPDNNTTTGDTLPSLGSGALLRNGGVTWTFASGTGGGDIVSPDNSALNLAGFPAAPAVNPKTAGLQINFNSTGYSNLVLTFSHRPSSSSSNTMVIQYNLNRNSGSWVDFQTLRIEPTTNSGNTFYFRNIDLTAISGLNNNPLAAIRLVSDVDSVTGQYRASQSTSNYATNGTWRFDVLTVKDGGGVALPNSISFQSQQTVVAHNAGQQFVRVQLSQPATSGDSVTYSVSYAPASNSSDVALGAGFASNQLVRALAVGSQLDSFAFTPVANNAAGENDTLYFNLTQLTGNLQLGASTLHTVIITGPSAIPSNFPLYTAAQIRGLNLNGGPDSLGVYCRVRGVIYSSTQRPSGNPGFQTVLQDASGGISLFRNNSGLSYLPVAGDSVVAFGTVSVFRGLAQLNVDSIFLLGSGMALKLPAVLGVTDTLNENTESNLIRINNLTIASGTWPSAGNSANVTVTNGVNQYLLRIVNSTDIDGSPAPIGTFNLIGLGSQFTTSTSAPYLGGYQILPRSVQDILQAQVDLYPKRLVEFPDSLLAGRDTTVKVYIQNQGNTASSNYNVQLWVNGFRVDSVGVNNSLLPGDSALISLNLPATASPCGIYQVKTIVQHTGDNVLGNDTLSRSMRIYIPQPVINLSRDTVFCASDSLIFSIGASAFAPQWQRDGQDIVGATGVSLVVRQSGSYRLKWTGSNNCQTFSRAYQVTVNPLPTTPTLSASGPLNFCSGSSVTLTSTTANSYVWLRNDTVINGQSGVSLSVSQSGQYKVEVSSAAGCKLRSSATQVTVNPVVPVSVSISTASNTVCQNSNVQFTAQVTNGGNTPVFQWKINNVNVGANNAVFTTGSLSNNDVVTVQVTSNAVCAQPVTAQSNALAMSVTPTVVPTVVINASQNTICSGSSVNFSANLINGGSNPQYQWIINSQNVGTGTTFSSNSLQNGDTIRLSITSNATCAQPTSVVSNFIRMAVNPVLTPSVSISANNLNLCVGGTALFTATPVNGGSNPVYQWQVNGQNAGTNSSTFNTTSLNDGQIVTVKLTSDATCAQPLQVTSNSLTVNVSPLISPTVSAAVSANPVCLGATANFNIASSTGGGTSPVYQWLVNGIQRATGATFSANNLGNGDSVRVLMTSSSACANPSSVLSDAIVIGVTQPAQPSVTISTQNQSICPGQTATFQAIPTNGGTAPLYQWFVNGNSQGAATSNNVFVVNTLINNDKVRVQITSNAGCLSTNQALSSELTIQVQPSAPATVQLTASANNLCGSSPVKFSTNAGLGGSNPQFQWFVNGVVNANQADTLVLSNPNDFDSVRVVMTSNASCAIPAVASSQSVILRVFAVPVAPSINANGSLSLCSGDQLVLSTSSGNNLQWMRNNVALPAETGLSLTVNQAGVYVLKTTGSGGCTSLSNALTVVVNSLPPVPTITPSGTLTFCQGGSVLLSSSALSGNQWLLNNAPLTGATATSINVQAGGQYRVQVTNGNGCRATSTSLSVTVNALPGVPVVNNSGSNNLCQGDTVTLSTPTAQSYQWLEGGQPLSGETLSSIKVSQSGNYSVRVSNAAGCERTSTGLSIVVNSRPSTPQIVPQNNTTFCEGGQVVLKSNSSTNNQWLRNGNPVTGATLDSFIATQSGLYSVVVTNVSGCTATSTTTSVVVNSLPSTPVVTANGPLIFCAGNQVTLKTTTANGYQWLLNNQPIAGGFADSLVVNADGNYSVVVSNSFGCQQTSAPTQVVVKTLPPVPVINASSNAICSGDQLWLVSTPAFNYQWLLNSQPISNSANDSIQISQAGQYVVKATNQDGCSNQSVPFTLVVNPLPAQPVLSAGGSLILCAGQKVVLFSNSSTGNQWSRNGNLLSGATNDTLHAELAGDYRVVVTTIQGCSATSSPLTVVVNALPTIPVPGVSGALSFCQGDTVKLGVSTSLTPQWLFNGAAIPGATADSVLINASGSYSLLVTDTNSCSIQSAPYVFTVRPVPAVPQITASGAVSFCQGGGVTLRSSSSTNNQWYLDGLPGFGLTLDSLTLTTTSLVKVKVTNAQGCSAVSTPVQVTAFSLPATPSIQALGSTTFCSGGQLQLISSQVSGNQWLLNGQSISGQTTDTLLVSNSGNYSVRVTNAQSCSSTSATTTVTVNTLPATPTISASGVVTFCDGGSVRLTSSLTGGNQWLLNGQPIANANQDTLRVSTTGTYSVRFTNSNGCSSISQTQVITVNPLPNAVNITSTNSLTFCQGGQAVLRAGGSATGYQWWLNGQVIAGAVTDSFVATQAGTYVLQIFNSFGCSALSTAVSITVNSLPATPLLNLSGTQSLCAGSTLVLTTTASGPFQWLLNGFPISGANSNALSVTTAGLYSLQVSNASGCFSTSSAVQVNLVPLPPKPNVLRVNDSLLSSAPAGNQWYLVGFGPFPNGNLQNFVPNTAGSYYVIVTVNGCSSVSSDTIAFVGSSVQTVNASLPVTIWPNPSSGIFSVKLEENLNAEETRFEMLDLSGRRLMSETQGAVSLPYTIHAEGLAEGMYLLRVVRGNRTAIVRVQILK